MKYYRGEIKPEAIGPEGQSPEIVKINAQSTEKEIVRKVVADLLRNEKVVPSDITILTPHKESKSIWNTGDCFANCPITWQRTEQGMENNIFCSTIHSFKGLESPVVILTETDAIREVRKDELLYVATSRANSHLIIIRNMKKGSMVESAD
ncbi:MAG: ATP-binding domain-containing protein [Deltaproteobacteria bacterium]|nr:ATP-binding domain-containing protein [Deltaproteobacteria bacterium]MBW2662445.1 ATP-binding domain-containing protein [Deltaproteobacteria bacterium]